MNNLAYILTFVIGWYDDEFLHNKIKVSNEFTIKG
jgi:hypothetical protein